jgi:UDP-3-O-[3-hydroxymyristoyl] N-acetylglucosamine deacetylase
MNQKTIEKAVGCSGVGLHTGERVHLTFHPAGADTGIVFAVENQSGTRFLYPRPDCVIDTSLATNIGCNGDRLGTVEHVLGAVRGLGIDNVIIEVSGSEVPIMDGSAASFVLLLSQAGLKEQRARKKVYALKRRISIGDEEKWIEAEPYPGFRVDYSIQFPHPLIGSQRKAFLGDAESFARAISKARTFGFLHHVEMLQARGLIAGGSLESALVLDEAGVVNSEGLRFADEPVCHKLLDFIGDMALLPYPLHGAFRVHCAGHKLHNEFLCRLAAQESEYLELKELGGVDSHHYPGTVGDVLQPVQA